MSFRKNSLPSGSGHGEKVFWGGCGAVAGKCATKIYGCRPEREQCGKDQLTEVTGTMVTKGTEAIYGKIYEKKYFGTRAARLDGH